MEPAGALARVGNAQASVMNSLLQPDRLARLVEQGAVDGAAAYTAVQFLGDVRRGLWSELRTPGRAVDPFRRNTQRVYLDVIDNRLNGGTPQPEVRALLRGELRTLRSQIVAAIPSALDRASRVHLEDARDQVDEILDPRAMRVPVGRGGGPGGVPALRFDYDNDPFLKPPDGCWTDYSL
jgi:hypothetical protein